MVSTVGFEALLLGRNWGCAEFHGPGLKFSSKGIDYFDEYFHAKYKELLVAGAR